MKLLTILIPGLLVTAAVHATPLSSCHESCFNVKVKCNTLRGHTFNRCDHDLFTCKARCNSGKAQEVYVSTIPLDIVFQPLSDIDS